MPKCKCGSWYMNRTVCPSCEVDAAVRRKRVVVEDEVQPMKPGDARRKRGPAIPKLKGETPDEYRRRRQKIYNQRCEARNKCLAPSVAKQKEETNA